MIYFNPNIFNISLSRVIFKRIIFYSLSVSSDVMSAPLSEVGSAFTTTTDGSEAEGDSNKSSLPRSQSERLLAVCKEHVIQERQLQEKYHDLVRCQIPIILIYFSLLYNNSNYIFAFSTTLNNNYKEYKITFSNMTGKLKKLS